MYIHRLDDETVAIDFVNRFLLELLQNIPECADPGDNVAAMERLYPSPSGGRDDEQDDDWTEYVEPELKELFQSALKIVQSDLKKIIPGDAVTPHRLNVPFKHLDPWVNTLNQARIVLATRHNLEDRSSQRPLGPDDPRATAMLQLEVYTIILDCFVEFLSEEL